VRPNGHRILFNGDCNTFFYNPKLWQPEGGPYSAKVAHRYVDLLADSGVDTFLVNPNVQVAWYPSKVWPKAWDGYRRGDREFFRAHAVCAGVTPDWLDRYLDMMVAFMNLYIDLLDAGVDWVAETAAACRRRGISPWLSIRMNDMHGAKDPQGSFMNCPLFKDDSNRLKSMGLPGEDYINWYRAGLNYELKPVRDFYFALIRELVEDYDYEGIELDWWRNPLCCEPEASAEAIETMLGWIADIRALTQARAHKTGRPYPLGLRIPADLNLVRTLGLDVREMARRELIDFVGPSNFWQTAWDVPHDELARELGDEVAVYGVIEDAPNWVPGYIPEHKRSDIRYLSASAELIRGNAAGKLALGADGIEFFNFFCTDQTPHNVNPIPGLFCNYPAIRNVADLAWLRGQPKHYAFATARPEWSERLNELVSPFPVYITPKSRQTFRLPMCAESGAKLLTIQVVIAKTGAPPSIGVMFNGSWPRFIGQATDVPVFPVGPYTRIPPDYDAYNVTFDTARIAEGWNGITIYNNNEPGKTPLDNAVRVMSVELGVNA
jgi:hypothetical protein